MTAAELIDAYGLGRVTYFPGRSTAGVDARTATFLGSVGLPESLVFASRTDVVNPYAPEVDAITIGRRFDHYGHPCPEESREWWALGHLFTSLIAVDPVSGRVYAFPEGALGHVGLHRDIESLVFALIELRRVEIDHDNGVDPEELAARFRDAVGAFDPTAFADEASPWSLAMEELEHGIW
ncbi:MULTISPECIES: SUKH-4 family immunity protein [unclassified Streptomyces]|uniref:SUKH-4 family immunity protein n=1 Tax=unclassified Streptomyces TaxID=2593676 RepID=UPI001F3E1781|nr:MULTISPECIES: SUKH-4 family immunity protein [unclassified Streptomyces]